MGELTRDDLADSVETLKTQLDELKSLLEAHDTLTKLEADSDRLLLLRIATRLNFPTVQQLTDHLTDQEIMELKALAVLDNWFGTIETAIQQPPKPRQAQKPQRAAGMLTPDEALRHFEKAG